MDVILNSLTNMSVGQFLGDAAGMVLLLSVFVEFTPIKINPVSMFLRWLGRKINVELYQKVNAMEEKVDKIERDAAEREALECRIRILRFADEIFHGQKHSKEHYDQMLSDIDWYEQYCVVHPEFKNNKAVMAKQRILDMYQIHIKNNDFL